MAVTKVKGLLCRVPVDTVCFPLQRGKVKELRRYSGFIFTGQGSADSRRRFAGRFQFARFISGADLRACRFCAGEHKAHMVIFFFLEVHNGSVPVYKHF